MLNLKMMKFSVVKNHKILCSWSFLAFCLFYTITHLLFKINGSLNSDISSELILGKLVAEEGNLMMSMNWFYPTEIRVLQMQVIYGFFFRFFDSYFVVRILSSISAYVIFLASLFFLLKSLDLTKFFPIVGGILLLPLSYWYSDVMLMGMYYLPLVTLSFAILGLLALLVKRENFNIYEIGFIFILSIFGGINGLRLFIVLFLPMLLAGIWSYFSQQNEKGCRILIVSSIAFLGAVFGYLVNHFFLANYFQFHNYQTGLQFKSLEFLNIAQIVSSFLVAFGYVSEQKCFSYALIQNAFAVFFFSATLFAWWSLSKIRDLTPSRHFFSSMSLVSLLLMFSCYIFTSMELVPRYFVPVIVYCPIVISIAIDAIFSKKNDACYTEVQNTPKSFKIIRYFGVMPIAIFVCVFAFMAVRPVYKDLVIPKHHQSEKQVLASFLTSNGFYNGYATFWNANVLTELSNGKIEVWAIQDVLNSSSIYQWLQRKDHITRKPDGKLFILLSKQEDKYFSSKYKMPKTVKVFQNNSYVIYGFDNEHQLPSNW